VSGCEVGGNKYSGIFVNGSGSIVIGNTCIGNNTANFSGSAGIYIGNKNTRVEDNHVTASGYAGIQVGSGFTNNIIIKNSVSGNGVNNYDVPAGNDLGPVGTAATATSPWANISH
jgi:parallel beta-helix repeat protein